jgi:hypothetical protein
MRNYFFYIFLILPSALLMHAQEYKEESIEAELPMLDEEVQQGNVSLQLIDKTTGHVGESLGVPWSFAQNSRTLNNQLEFMGIREILVDAVPVINLYAVDVSGNALRFLRYVLGRVASGDSWKDSISLYINESDTQNSIEALKAIDFIQNDFLRDLFLKEFKNKLIGLADNEEWSVLRDTISQLQFLSVAPYLSNVLVNYLCNESLYIKNVLPHLKTQKSKSVALDGYKSSAFGAAPNWIAGIRIEKKPSIFEKAEKKLNIFKLTPDQTPLLLSSMNVDPSGSVRIAFAQNENLMAITEARILKIYSIENLLTNEADNPELLPNPILLIESPQFNQFTTEWVLFSPRAEFVLWRIVNAIEHKIIKMPKVGRLTEIVNKTIARDARYLAISPINKDLWAVGHHSNIKIYDAKKNEELHTLIFNRGTMISTVIALIFSPNGEKLAAARGDGIIIVWDVATGKEVYTFPVDVKEYYDLHASLCFSHDSNWLVAGFRDSSHKKPGKNWSRTIKIWDMKTGNFVFDIDPRETKHSIVRNICDVSLSPDNKNIAYIAQKIKGKATRLVVQPFLPVALCDELYKLPLQSISLLCYCLMLDANNKPIKLLKNWLPYFNVLPQALQTYFMQKNKVKNTQALQVDSLEAEEVLSPREKGKELEGAGKGKKRQRTEETSTQPRRKYEPEPKHRAREKEREE